LKNDQLTKIPYWYSPNLPHLTQNISYSTKIMQFAMNSLVELNRNKNCNKAISKESTYLERCKRQLIFNCPQKQNFPPNANIQKTLHTKKRKQKQKSFFPRNQSYELRSPFSDSNHHWDYVCNEQKIQQMRCLPKAS